MKENGVSGLSLVKAMESMYSTSPPGLQEYGIHEINTENCTYPTALQIQKSGVKRVPKYWMFLLNGHQ
eukprot:scaffold39770_cov56-Attheya_sp.AAC.1